jgi:hypothetical protein
MRDQETTHGHVRGSHIFLFQIKAAHIRVVENSAIKYVQSDGAWGLRLVRGGWIGLSADTGLSSE